MGVTEAELLRRKGAREEGASSGHLNEYFAVIDKAVDSGIREKGKDMEDVQTLIEKVKGDIQDEKSDEEIFQSILPFWGRSSQTDGEVVESLATIPHVNIVKILQRLSGLTMDKKVRKTIKRSLYRLKSRGMVAEEVHPDKGKSILRPLQAEPAEGFGSAIDFLGQRLVLLVIPHAVRGLTVIQGIVSDIRGLVDFSGEEMTRKGFKDFFREMKEKSLFPIVDMDPSYVGFLLAQAYSLTLEKGRTPPKEYPRLKSEIEKMKKDYERPLIYSCLQPAEIEEEDRILRRTGDLLKTDLFSTWRIEEEQIQPYADAVWEAEESKLVLNPTQKEARFQEIYQKALSELFPDGKRLLYQRRLEEMAYVLFKLGKGEEARVSLAAAVNLEKPLNPIQPNPFLFQLVIKSIFALLAEAYEKKVKEPTLIVTP